MDWLTPVLESVVRDETVLVNHSVSYDMMCSLEQYPELEDLIWEAYAVGGIICTHVREKLLDIAEGKHGGEIDHTGERVKRDYDLANIMRRHFGYERDKDTWRTRYNELEDIPIEQWPQGARDYAIFDATDPLELFELQERRAREMRYPLPDQTAQTRTDLALRLMSCWGVRTDGERVEKLADITQTRFAELKVELQEAGYVRVKRTPKGKESKDTKAIRAMVERSYSGPTIPYTKPSAKFPSGQIK
ncbi:MAG: hypothetical protein ACTSX8_10640, partial [Alphaproteobacteria bacterium]